MLRIVSAVLLVAALVATPLAPTSQRTSTGCVLSLTKLRTSGCTVLRSDTASRASPLALWGSVDCASGARVRRVALGSNRRRRADGPREGVGAYRELTVFDGDDVYGERCELGRNSWIRPTFQNYREGQHRVTFASLRLPRSFPLGTSRWQTVIQMKQSQPSADGGGGPVLELQAYRGRFFLVHNWHNLWSTPASKGRWFRLAFDVRYSQSASAGSVTMYVDRNGDGDASDRGERSPTFHVNTLRRERADDSPEGLGPGRSIPSHLRVGIYHDPSYRCPRPAGCSIEVADVQVVGVPGS